MESVMLNLFFSIYSLLAPEIRHPIRSLCEPAKGGQNNSWKTDNKWDYFACVRNEELCWALRNDKGKDRAL